MALLISETPVPAKRPAPAYPTLAESWGILGWYLLVALVVGVPLYLGVEKALASSPGSATVLLATVPNLALLGVLRWRAGKRWLPLRPQGQAPPGLYAVLPALVLASIVVLSLLDFLHLPNWAHGAFQKMMKNPASALVGMAVAAPVLEEMLCRGVVLQGLLRSRRPWVAIGQSALLFSLMHFNPAQSAHAFFSGLLLGWLYYRTRSLCVCVAMHALNNSLAFIAMRWGPVTWQTDPLPKAFGSAWVYAGAVGLSALIVAAVLWWVQRTTSPPVWALGKLTGEVATAVNLDAAAA
ncbi:CPBP family intramembrane glutamic endopeptidase [Hymenobacter sp. PAMC 26628]|uniref:CPBP family intramembrane glutamic endopeptidase n=1 Tax=Hymenobacter sp. PAMC 26628 TaxID=1484118 RepID=UPI0007702064|nr:type II CAAX endopeptidase family protein [Hymenobacter sp. PAMC 26628]AMJ65258.1 hypothetical protein AXW84_07335 [Hymenobacter sp. PAMC 26628]